MALKHYENMGYLDSNNDITDYRDYMMSFEDNAREHGGIDLYDIGYLDIGVSQRLTPVKGSFDYDDTQFKIDENGMLKYIGSETDGSKINIPYGVVNLSGTFAGTNITSIPKIPDTVMDINGAFADCKQLTSVEGLPNSIILADGAFENCTGITSVDFPETSCFFSLDGTFKGCDSLQTVNFHDLGADHMTETFKGCAALTDVQGSISLGHYGSGKNGYCDWCFQDMDDVPMYYASTFEDCVNLKSTPDFNIIFLGGMNRTFANCTNLERIGDLPGAVYEMNETFENCTSLEVAKVPQGYHGIDRTHMARTYKGCSNLKNIDDLSTSGAGIGNLEETFMNCTSLETLVKDWAPKDATCIRTFAGCTNLKKAPLSPGHPIYQEDVFIDCPKMEEQYVPNSMTFNIHYNTNEFPNLRNDLFNQCVVISKEAAKKVGKPSMSGAKVLFGEPVYDGIGDKSIPVICTGFDKDNYQNVVDAIDDTMQKCGYPTINSYGFMVRKNTKPLMSYDNDSVIKPLVDELKAAKMAKSGPFDVQNRMLSTQPNTQHDVYVINLMSFGCSGDKGCYDAIQNSDNIAQYASELMGLDEDKSITLTPYGVDTFSTGEMSFLVENTPNNSDLVKSCIEKSVAFHCNVNHCDVKQSSMNDAEIARIHRDAVTTDNPKFDYYKEKLTKSQNQNETALQNGLLHDVETSDKSKQNEGNGGLG